MVGWREQRAVTQSMTDRLASATVPQLKCLGSRRRPTFTFC